MEFRLLTPLLLPAVAEEEQWVTRSNNDFARGEVTIPGSAIKGAVRSLHEAMFNGCFRVVDDSYVPGYRAAAKTDDGWTLAIVTETDSAARPTGFQLCDPKETVWVDAIELDRHWPRQTGIRHPRSGQLVYIEGPVEDSSLGRFEMPLVRSVEVVSGAPDRGLFPTASAQIFLVTDTAARPKLKRNRQPARCLWASSVLTPSVVDFNPTAGQDMLIWERFVRAAAGGEDRRACENAERKAMVQGKETRDYRNGPEFVEVKWRNRVVGVRALRTGFFFRGDVLWVKLGQDGQIADLKLSVIWREPGAGSVGGRLNGHEPCLSHASAPSGSDEASANLCLSCATFGAADTSGHRAGEGRQESYAGHVRFGSARTSIPVSLRRVPHLAPMGSPKPGSGMFYLDLAPMPRRLARHDLPSRWGGTLDPGGRRAIRGRKFYWHADPDRQADYWSQELQREVEPRYVATPAQRENKSEPAKTKEMVREGWLVEAGATLTAEVAFDLLPEKYLGPLLASLDPARLAPIAGRRGATIAIHLGGGKALGLGSATVTLTDVKIWDQKERYTRATATSLPEPGVDSNWLTVVDQLAGPIAVKNLPLVMRLLDVDGTSRWKNHVTYPPAAQWREVGSDEFVKSYTFFMNANGQQLRDRPRDWLPLPASDAADPSLPIVDGA
ncbi:MAG: RAMP superfamily CRISPR-associated protein [Dermatophilaceae bacterium]